MEHHVGVRYQIVWIGTQIALNARVSLQHRGVLFALGADLASTPNIISQVMLTHYLHHPTRSGLLNEGLGLQHDKDERPQRLNSNIFLSYHLKIPGSPTRHV